jgi:hypothetical protein
MYIVSLEATVLYLMTELFPFNAPKCISELLMIVINFDQLKQIMLDHEKNNVYSNKTGHPEKTFHQ